MINHLKDLTKSFKSQEKNWITEMTFCLWSSCVEHNESLFFNPSQPLLFIAKMKKGKARKVVEFPPALYWMGKKVCQR